jgi:outer membrane cobalamin receptor
VVIRADEWPAEAVPIPRSIVGDAAIDRRPGGDVGELLASLAGVRIASIAGPGTGTGASIRGSSTEQVLVLVDGRRWSTAQGGGADLSSLPLDFVSRVEVLRGGASALWGTDALAGVVHVRTREVRPGAAGFRASGGSRGEQRVAGWLSKRTPWGTRTRVGASLFAASDSYAPSGSSTNGDISRTEADLRTDLAVGGHAARVNLSAFLAERGVPGSDEFPSPTARLRDSRISGALRIETSDTPDGDAFVDLSWFRAERTYREPGAAFGPVDDRHRNARFAGDARFPAQAGPVALVASTGASLDHLLSTTDGDRRRVLGYASLRAGSRGRLLGRDLTATAALRVDAIEGFAPTVAPRAGVSWELLPRRAVLSASAGLSRRAPSFDDLFWPARATAAGNPGLRPETGRDLDAGVLLSRLPGGARLEAHAFLRDIHDLIQWTPGAAGIWRPHNIGRARIFGWEAEAAAAFPLGHSLSATLSGTVTRLDARDRTGEPNTHGMELPHRAPWSGSAGVIVRHASLGEIETVWRGVNRVFLTRSNTKALGGRLLGDLHLRIPVRPDLRAVLSVTNLTDRDARDLRQYPLPGRSFSAGLTWGRTP